MTHILSAILPLLLASNPATEWTADSEVKVRADFDASDPDKMFKAGKKELKELADVACKDKGFGKAKMTGEVMVSGIGLTANGRRYATLNASFFCEDS